MKKVKMLLFAILIFLCIPMSSKAVSISNPSLLGDSEKKIGEEVNITFEMPITGIEADSNLELGGVVFEIDFDDNIFVPTKIETSEFQSQLFYSEDTGYFVMSVLEETARRKYCVIGSCNKYRATITFVIKDTTSTKSSITVTGAAALLIDKAEPSVEEVEDNDIIQIMTGPVKSHNVSIKQAVVPVTEPPKTVITEKAPEVKVPITSTQNPTVKSSNADLKSLLIENYDIEFNKNTTEYTIDIENDVNSFNISAEVEDNKASYNIIGAEDLKSNNYKVSIEVTAEDGIKKTYIVRGKIIEDKNDEKQINAEIVEDKVGKEKAFVNKDFVMRIGILFGGIVFVVIIIFIINFIRNKKIDKMLDDL